MHFSFTDVRFAADLAVSGTASWDRYAHTVHCVLRLRQTDPAGQVVKGSAVAGDLVGDCSTSGVGVPALRIGSLGGQEVALTFDAP